MKNSSLYDQDYLAWIEKTGQQLADAKWDEIDLKNLIEEIQDLGKSQRQALLSKSQSVKIFSDTYSTSSN